MNARPSRDVQPTAEVDALAAEVRSLLREVADPSRAAGQQAYMKTEEPFLGVRLPQVRAAVGTALKSSPLPDRHTWEALCRRLFDDATCREERYAALAVLRHGSARRWRDVDCLPLVRHVVERGAWWDLVDDAAHALTDALVADPEAVAPVVRRWAVDDDLWVRRVAVLSQLQRRDATDRALLADVLDAQLGRPEFWLRKASGWALRDLSYADPDWVVAWLDAHADSVAPLTRREALKAIERGR